MERATTGPLLSRRFHLVLLHLTEEARRDLEALTARPVRTVHSLRTRMKNLRALLQLIKPRLPKAARKTAAALAEGLKDAFSEQRDAQVMGALRAKFPSLRTAGGREKAVPQNAECGKKAKADASRLIRVIAKLGLNGLTWSDIFGGYLRCYRAGRKAMNACERERSTELFHKWRRPVKELFYQSQVLQPLDGMTRRRRAADRLSGRLGEFHDLHLLRATAKKSRSPHGLKQIAKKLRALKPAIFKAAEKLFGERPREIERALARCVKFQPAISAQAVRQA